MKKLGYKAVASSLLVAGLLLAPVSAVTTDVAAAASSAKETTASIQLWVDGKQLKLSAPIYKENGVTLAPMTDLLNALEASSVYEKKSQTVIIRSSTLTITLAIGQKEAIVNGKTVKMDAAATTQNNVVYVPLRFIAEKLEAKVEWDKAANAIKVKSWYYQQLEKYEEEEETEAVYREEDKLSSTQIVDLFDESVLMIMTNKGLGSGVVIGEDLILTNYHVIFDATSAIANSIYYDEFKVKGVVAYDEEADLAILRTEEPMELVPVGLSYDYLARKGDRVYAIGSPLGFMNTVSTGLISNYHFENGVSYLQTNAQTDHGSSGGALFNEYGELVGITTAGMDNSLANIGIAVSAFHAAELVESVTEDMVNKAGFLTPPLPDTLKGVANEDIQKLMKKEFSVVQTLEGDAEITNWQVRRDADGWLLFTANIDPVFYLYYGAATAGELRLWSVNLAHELHRMLPDEQIQVRISFQRDYSFQPRGLASDEVTPLGEGKWRVQYPVMDLQLKDQLYIETRF
ncbi:trypsin-like peptidase domain-containing protein [Paenibacillus sp. NPDC057967]|uniref:trypsin-like peptidase domain-containing protein n=1 Tax=Paenibacillus sp. NPDC057967 TaxID=3346293 RepID=UPI0036DA3FDA